MIGFDLTFTNGCINSFVKLMIAKVVVVDNGSGRKGNVREEGGPLEGRGSSAHAVR